MQQFNLRGQRGNPFAETIENIFAAVDHRQQDQEGWLDAEDQHMLSGRIALQASLLPA